MRKTFFSQSLVVGIIALFSLSGPLLAQQPAGSDRFTIEGTVVDNTNNEPIAGATVRLKSGLRGTATNAEGKFVVKECSAQDVFQVSFIGYKPKNFTVGKHRRFTIYLEENSTQIEQVVVTGFQKLKKNSFTGSATIVTSEDLKKVNSKDAVKALQVFDPSFRIMDNLGFGADPNQMHEISIRGASSISQNRGLDVENQRLTQRTNLRDNPNSHGTLWLACGKWCRDCHHCTSQGR